MTRREEEPIVAPQPRNRRLTLLPAVTLATVCLLSPGGAGYAQPISAMSGVVRGSDPTDGPSATASSAITEIRIFRIHDSDCQRAPVTFGQPFIEGDLQRHQTLSAQIGNATLPTQVNVKARNEDGSARHAVITIVAPCNAGDSGQPVALVAQDDGGKKNPNQDLSLKDVLNTSFNTSITLAMRGEQWRVSARDVLEQVREQGGCDAVTTFCQEWLNGPLAAEWVVGAPLIGPTGNAHPNLTAYFAVRAYGPAPVERIRVDVVVENTWAYEKSPSNYHYQPTIRVAGQVQPAYQPEAFTHYHHARWHHVVWWGEDTQAPLYAKLDSNYLQATPALPSYAHGRLHPDLYRKVRQSCAPMKNCDQTAQMGRGGAQAAIGPLPQWGAAFVIDPDYRIYRWMLANSDALGAYSFHFRQRDTGQPLSVRDHPCATLIGPARVARCPVPPHGDDRFPTCGEDCKTPALDYDIAHHPAPAYVAYLATGDWFYASEMTFMAAWVCFWQNPDYREYAGCLVHQTQVRGQAWSLRTLGYAAYLLPDDSPKKAYFNKAVADNIAWYNKHYVDNPDANDLGGIYGGGAVIYSIEGHDRVGIATWQQSFMTWAAGNLVDLGFPHAAKFRDWISRFQVGLMTAPGYCWPLASKYAVRVRDTQQSPYYTSFATIYDNTFPEYKDVGCDLKQLNALQKARSSNFAYPPGTMTGYPTAPMGFPANFQIGLAAAAIADIPNAVKAWNLFATRPVQPDYSSMPQFAIVPTYPRPR